MNFLDVVKPGPSKDTVSIILGIVTLALIALITIAVIIYKIKGRKK